MSEIIGFVGMSHSPFATLLPPGSPAEPGESQYAAYRASCNPTFERHRRIMLRMRSRRGSRLFYPAELRRGSA